MNLHRIIELLTQKIFIKLSKIWVWDPGSGIRKKPIQDPGVRKDPDPQHCLKDVNFGRCKIIFDTEELGRFLGHIYKKH